MPSGRQSLRRSPYEDKPSGMDAWLGGEEQPPDDGRDVSNVQAVPNVQRKVIRIAGPKWPPELLQQARDAVLFLRQQSGRPTMTLTEALDEAVERWLTEMRDEHNGGEGFPPQGGLR